MDNSEHEMLHIAALEAAINRCRRAALSEPQPAQDLALLATLYGMMIYRREEQVDLGAQSADLRSAVSTWRGVSVDAVTLLGATDGSG